MHLPFEDRNTGVSIAGPAFGFLANRQWVIIKAKRALIAREIVRDARPPMPQDLRQ